MSSLGSLTVTLKLNDQLTAELKSALAQMGKAVSSGKGKKIDIGQEELIKDLKSTLPKVLKFGESINKMKVPMSRLFGDPREATAYGNRIAKSLNKIVPAGMEAKTQIMHTAKGWGTSTKLIETKTKDLAKSTNRSFLDMMKGAFNLKNLMGMIAHYITFSIGVQMVQKITQGIGESIEAFKRFERAAANAAVVSGYIGGSFSDISNKMMTMSKVMSRETVYSATEIQEAFYQISSAGIDIAKVTKTQLIPILNYAAATQGNLEDATEDVLTVMKAYGLTMDDTTRIVDTFTQAITSSFFNLEKMSDFMQYVAPIAGALGISLEETVAAGMLLVDMGMEGGMAGQRLNMVFTRLLDPTGEAEESLTRLGLSVEDLNPELYTFTEILFKLRAAGFGASEASDMFRSRTASAAAVLVEGAYDIARYNQELLLSKGITESVAAAQEGTFYGSMKLMTNAIEEASISIGETLAPIITAFGNNIKAMMPTLTKYFKMFVSAIPTIIQLVKWFLVYKAALFIVTKATAALGIAQAFLGIKTAFTGAVTGGLVVSLYHSIAAMGITTTVATALGISLTTAAIAMTILTLGAAAIAAIAILSTTGILGMADAASELTDTTAQTGLKLESLAGGSFKDLLSTSKAWELAIYEDSISAKGFSESLDLINEKAKELKITMEEYTNEDFVLAAIEIQNPKMKDWSGNLTEGTKSEISNYYKILEEHWEKEGNRFQPKTLEWWEALTIFPAIYEGIENLVLGTSQAMTDMGYENARSYMAGFLNVDVSKIFDESSLIEEATKAFTGGKTFEDIAAKKQYDLLILKIADDLSLYRSSLVDIVNTETDAKKALDALNDAKLNDATNTQKIINLETRYAKITALRSTATSNLMSSIKGIVTEIRSMSSLMDNAVQIVEDSFKADMEWENASRELTDAIVDESDASLKLSEALAIHGQGSNEAANAERALTKAIADRIALEQQTGELKDAKELAFAQIEYSQVHGIVTEKTQAELIAEGKTYEQITKMIENYSDEQKLAFQGKKYKRNEDTGEIVPDANKMPILEDMDAQALQVSEELTEAQINLMNTTYDLGDAREKVSKATGDQAAAEAKLAAFNNLQENFVKYTTEKTKNYLEVLLKIYDIKEKLYKLEEDQQKQQEELFEKLAEEGLLDQETIDLYRKMEEAKYEQLKLNKPLMDIMGKSSDEERNLIKDYVNKKITIDELTDSLKDYYKNNPEDTTNILTSGDIDTVEQYAKATWGLDDSIDALGDKLGPLIQDLVDMQAISTEAAKAFYDLMTREYEVAKGNSDLALEYTKMNTEINSLIGNTTRLAKSMMNLPDETIVSVFDELIKSLGITGNLAGEDADQLEVLNSFYDTSYDSLDDFSDAQLIAAATMIDMAQGMNLWEDGMTGSNTAILLGADSLNTFVNDATIALENEQSMLDVTKELANAMALLESATATLAKTFRDFISLSTGMDPLEVGMLLGVKDLVSQFGSLENVFGELGEFDITLPENLTAMWDTEDWESWATEISKTPELISAINQAVPGLNVETTWNGSTWQTEFNKLNGQQRTDFIDALNAYSGNVELNTLWDGTDWSSFYTNFYSQNEQVKGVIDKFFTDNNIPIPVDEKGFVTTITGLGPTGMTAIKAALLLETPAIIPLAFPDSTFWGTLLTSTIDEMQLAADQNPVIIPFHASFDEGTGGIEPIPEVKSSWLDVVLDIFSSSIGLTWGKGGIAGLQHGITETKGPQHAIIGEAGAEAVVPLEGKNKKYGENILRQIIPQYFPGLKFMQAGGVVGSATTTIDGTKIEINAEGITDEIEQSAIDFYKNILLSQAKLLEAMTLMQTTTQLLTDSLKLFSQELSAGLIDTLKVGISEASNVISNAALYFQDSFKYLSDSLRLSGELFSNMVEKATWFFRINGVQPAAQMFERAATAIYWATQGKYSGGVYQKGGVFNKPTAGVFGEAGPEALIPLVGANKKYGEELLKVIIPKYYPDLMMQAGGIFGVQSTGGATTYEDNNSQTFTITGPININGVQNVNDFLSQLKYKARVASR